MATSGTWAFDLDLADIIEEAYEMIGDELRSGYDYRTARRSLDLLMLEWQTRGTHLWTVKNATQTLTASTASYSLSNEKIDIVDASLRTDDGDTSLQTDIEMRRISVKEYAGQSKKLTEGRPIQYLVERAPTGITLTVWPVPDSTTTYAINYWYLERVEDTGKPGSNNVDVPSRFYPAMIAGLAHKLAMKKQKWDVVPGLKMEYEELYKTAADSMRDKSSLFFKPAVR